MMRRTPLKRGKPLKRKTWLRSVSKTNSYRRRPRDFVHMGKVAQLPCMVREFAQLVWKLQRDLVIVDAPSHELRMALHVRHVIAEMRITPCWGRIQVDHVGERPYGWRSPDDETAAMCVGHHGERTDYRSSFENFDAAEMRAWCDWAISVTRVQIEQISILAAQMT